ncbi:MAG: DsbE family thiol:disulfide interchange protein [Ahrensia sp.]|nr:DsbE family thiol:disulfide interchange protein [Ahrensia sp.]
MVEGDKTEATPPPARRRSLWLMAPVLVFGALAIVFAMQLLSGRDVSELPSALIGKPAPTFELPPLAGLRDDAGQPVPALSTDDLKGDVTLVNIFASWCAPCRAEHPVLMALAQRDDIKVMGINYKDNTENALRFLGSLGNPYSNVGTDERGRAAIDWGFYGIPETLLVDAQGIVRHKIVGPITAQKFEELQQRIAEVTGK